MRGSPTSGAAENILAFANHWLCSHRRSWNRVSEFSQYWSVPSSCRGGFSSHRLSLTRWSFLNFEMAPEMTLKIYTGILSQIFYTQAMSRAIACKPGALAPSRSPISLEGTSFSPLDLFLLPFPDGRRGCACVMYKLMSNLCINLCRICVEAPSRSPWDGHHKHL